MAPHAEQERVQLVVKLQHHLIIKVAHVTPEGELGHIPALDSVRHLAAQHSTAQHSDNIGKVLELADGSIDSPAARCIMLLTCRVTEEIYGLCVHSLRQAPT
jgi:hypothetical protein